MVPVLHSEEDISIEFLKPSDIHDAIFEYPKVNAYIEEKVNNLHSSISIMQEYNPQDNHWEVHHIVSDPVIGKKLLEPFKFEEETFKATLKKVVGGGSILTPHTKKEHSEIHHDYLAYFSKIYKDDNFLKQLRNNITTYLSRYANKITQVSLDQLSGEIITVVMQNTVNGYSHDMSKPSHYIGKFLAHENELLKPVNEIGTEGGHGAWLLSKTNSFIERLAIPFFKNVMIDKPARSIHADGINRENTFPKFLKSMGYTDKHIKANIKASFLAQETLHNLLFFLLYEYSRDLETQEIEWKAVFNFDYELSHKSLPAEIKKRVLMGLHEYPTGECVRKAAVPLKIHCEREDKDYFVKDGEFITYSPYAASHYPYPWQEYCKTEDGEGLDMQKLEKLTHLPFGFGQQMCPAHLFVVPVMSIILFEFLENYRIQLADSSQVCKPVMLDTLQADKDVSVILISRK